MNAFILRMAYLVRNFLARKMFPILRNYCQGEVLDVGGRIFYSFAKKKGFSFTHWTILELSNDALPDPSRNDKVKVTRRDQVKVTHPG